MKEMVSVILRKYVKSFITGGFICFLLLWRRGLFNTDDPIKAYRILCDAFFVPSVLYIGTGLLSLAKADGFFDVMTYSFEWMRLSNFFKEPGSMTAKSLYEYRKLKKQEGKRSVKLHLIITGMVFLSVAVWYQYLFYINT